MTTIDHGQPVAAEDILYGSDGGKDPKQLADQERKRQRQAAKAARQSRLAQRKPALIDHCREIASARNQIEELKEKAEENALGLESYADEVFNALPKAKQKKQGARSTHRCMAIFDRYDPDGEKLHFDWWEGYEEEYEGHFWVTLDQLAAAPKKIRDGYAARRCKYGSD